MNLFSLSYKTPSAILLSLLIFVIIGLFYSLYCYRKRTLSALTKKGSLRSTPLFITKIVLVSLSWFLATYALMQPMGSGGYGEAQATIQRHQIQEVVFLIDTSASMAEQDTRTKQSRLEFAKGYADAIASQLEGGKVGLYAFTSEPTSLVPITYDIFFLRMMLAKIRINEGNIAGTNFVNVLKTIRERLFHHPLTLVILSDGGDTHLEEPGRLHEIENLVKHENVRVITIGIGSQESELLKKIGNPYYFANTTAPTSIAKRIAKEVVTLKKAPEPQLEHPLYFQIPLAIAILCLIFYLFLPEVSILLLVLCSQSFCNLQEAAQFYEADMYDQAEKAYETLLHQDLNPYERTVVLYNLATTSIAAGHFEKGVIALEAIDKTLSGQNLAVALFRLAKKNKSADLYRQAMALTDDQELKNTAKVLLAALLENTPSLLPEQAIDRALSHLSFLQETHLNDKQQKAYRTYLTQQNETFLPLFQVKKTAELYQRGIAWMKEGEDARSRKAFIEVKSQIPQNPTLKLIRELNRTLTQNVLSPSKIEELVSEANIGKEELKMGLTHLKEGESLQARLYLLMAEQEMKRSIRKSDTPSTTLENGIDDLKTAIQLQRLSPSSPLVKQTIEEAIATVAPFPDQVVAMQKEAGGCQKSPWDVVFPLFNTGFVSAKEGHPLKALFNWDAALRAITHTKPPPKQNQKKFQKTLQYLQAMEEQDRPTQPHQVLTPMGEKPW